MDPTEAIADMSTQGTVSIPETTPAPTQLDPIRDVPYTTDDPFALKLRRALRELHVGYDEGIAAETSWHERVAFTVKTEKAFQGYSRTDFRGFNMRQSVGYYTVPVSGIFGGDTQEATLSSGLYELSYSLRRDHVDDDEGDLLRVMGDGFGRGRKRHPDVLVARVLTKNETCLFDNAPVFGPHKSIHGRDFTNTVTGPLTVDTYVAAVDMMASNQDASGTGLGVSPTIMLVPPTGAENAGAVLAQIAKMNADPSAERHYPIPEIVVAEEIMDGTDAVFLIDGSHDIKPIVYQVRQFGTYQDPDISDWTKVQSYNEWRPQVWIRDAAAVYEPMLIARIMPVPRPAPKATDPAPTTKPKKPGKTKRERGLDAAYDLYLYRLAHATASTADDVHRNSPTLELFAVALAKIHAQTGRITSRSEFRGLAELP